MPLADAYKTIKEAAETFKERHKIYGDNLTQVGKIMEILFPKGISLKTANDHERFHLLNLIIVKLTRYTNNFFPHGHKDSMRDHGIYSFILENLDDDTKQLLKEQKPEIESINDE